MAVEIISGVITIELVSKIGPQGPSGPLTSINSVDPSPGNNIDLEADVASAITITPDDPGDKVVIGETHSPRVDNPHGVTAVQAGADPVGSAAAVQGNLDTHEADVANPHAVSAAQAGAEPADVAIQAHLIDTANPHAVTAAQAGADPAGSAAIVAGALISHESDVANPHVVTAAQAGAEAANVNIQGHIVDTTNPHGVTAVQAGAAPVAHVTDTLNPHAVTALQAGADPAGSAAAVASDLNDHEIDVANPHAVTAAQAGADPAGSAAAVASDLNDHEIDVANPHGTTFTQAVTADAGTDILAAEAETLTDGSLADGLHTHAGVGGNSLQATWRFSTSIVDSDPGSGNFRYNSATPASVTELFVDNITRNGFNAFSILAGLVAGAEIYIQQASNPLAFLLVTLTGPAVDKTGYFGLPVTVDDSGTLPSNNQDCGFIVFTFGEPALAIHVADLANPHAVTAAQAGADPAGSAAVVAGALVTHESDVANPHAVTFTQAVAADGGTDISAAEAETLTDGSDADALHAHPSLVSTPAPYLLTGQWGQAASAMDSKVAVKGTGLMSDVVLVADADAVVVDADGVGVTLNSVAAIGNDTSVRAGDTDGTRLDQLPIMTVRAKSNATTNRRVFWGLAAEGTLPTDDNDMAGAFGVGVVYSSDRVDTNFQFVAHDGTTQTLVDTGIAVDTAVHHVEIVAASAASVTVRLLDVDGVEEATTTFTTELPAGSALMIPSATLTAVTAAVQTWTFYSMSVIVP